MITAALEKIALYVLKEVLSDSAKQELLAFLVTKGVQQPLVDILSLIIGVQAA